MAEIEAITAELLDKKYFFPDLRQDGVEWSAGQLARVYQRLLSVHSDDFDCEANNPPLARHLAHISKCLRRLEIGHLAPKLQDLTDKSRALRIISALDDKISARYKAPVAARRVRVVMKKEDQKGKTFKLKPRPPAAQEEAGTPERGKSCYPETPETNMHMIPSGRQLQRTPVAQERNGADQPAICRHESLASTTSESDRVNDIPRNNERADTIPSCRERGSSVTSNYKGLTSSNGIGSFPITSNNKTSASSIVNSLSPCSVTSKNEHQPAITRKEGRPTPIIGSSDRMSPITGNSDRVAPITGNSDRVAPMTGNSDRVAPMTGNSDRVAPITGNSDRVAPITGNSDRVTPITGNSDRVAPITGNSDRVAPITGNSDRVAPITGNSDRVAPITGNSDRVAPVTGNSDRVAPITSNSDRVAPITGNSDRVAPITGNSDRVAPITDNSDKVAPITGNSDRVALITGISDRVAPITGNSDRVTPIFVASDRVAPITGNTDRVASITGNSDRVALITGNSDRVAPITGNSDRVVPITCNSYRVAPITGNNDRVVPITSNRDRVAPVTSNSDSVAPITSNSESLAISTSTSGSPAFTITCTDRSLTIDSESLTITTSNSESPAFTVTSTNGSLTNDNDTFSTNEADSSAFSFINHKSISSGCESSATGNNKSLSTTSSDESLTCGSNSDGTYIMPAKKHWSESSYKVTDATPQRANDVTYVIPIDDKPSDCRRHRETDVSFHKGVDATYVVPTAAKHCAYSNHQETNVTFQKDVNVTYAAPTKTPWNESNTDVDATYITPTTAKHCGYSSHEETNVTLHKNVNVTYVALTNKLGNESDTNVDATYVTPKTAKHCGYSSHEETNATLQKDVNDTHIAPSNRHGKESNTDGKGLENEGSLLNDTVFKKADDTLVRRIIQDEKLFSTSDDEDSLEIFPRKHKASHKAEHHTLAENKPVVHAGTSKKANRNEETQVDAEVQAEMFAAPVEEDTCGNPEVRLNSTAHHQEDRRKSDEVTEESDLSQQVNPTHTIGRYNKSNEGTEKSGKKDKGKNKKCDAADEDSRDNLKRQEVKRSSRPKKHCHKNTGVTLENCYEEDEKENIIEREDVKQKGKAKRKTQVEPPEELLQRDKHKTTAAIEITNTLIEKLNRRGTEWNCQRIMGKESCVDAPDDIFLKPKHNKANNGKKNTEFLENTMADDAKKKAVKFKRRQRVVHKKSFSDNETETESDTPGQGVKLVTQELDNAMIGDVIMKPEKSRESRRGAIYKKSSKDDEMETGDTKAAEGAKLVNERLRNTEADDKEMKVVKPRERRKRIVLKFSSEDEAETEDAKMKVETAKGVKLENERLENTMANNVEEKAVKSKGRRQRAVLKKLSCDDMEIEGTKADKAVKLGTEGLKNVGEHNLEKKSVKPRGKTRRPLLKVSSDDESEADAKMHVETPKGVKLGTERLENTMTGGIEMRALKSRGRRQRAVLKKFSTYDDMEIEETKVAKGVKLDTEELENTVADGIEMNAVTSRGRRQRADRKKSSRNDEVEMEDGKAAEGAKLDTEELAETVADNTEMKGVTSRARRQRAVLKKFSTYCDMEIEDIKETQGTLSSTERLVNRMTDGIEMKSMKPRARRQRAAPKKFSSSETETGDAKMKVEMAKGVKLENERLENTMAHDIEKKSLISRGRRQRTVLKQFSIDDEGKIEDTKAAQGVQLVTEELENTMVHTQALEKKGMKSKGRRQEVIHNKSLCHDEIEAEHAKINVAASDVKIETQEFENTVACNTETKCGKSKVRRQRALCKKLLSDSEAEMEGTKMSVTSADSYRLNIEDQESRVTHNIKKEALKSKGGQRAIHKKLSGDEETEMQDARVNVTAVKSDNEKTKVKVGKGKGKSEKKKLFSDEGREMQDANMNVTAVKSGNEKTKVNVGKGKGKSEKKSEEEPCVEVSRGRRCKSRAMAAIQAILNDSSS